MQSPTQKIKALIFKYQDGKRVQVDERDITDWSWERVARMAKDLDCCGRDYEVLAV